MKQVNKKELKIKFEILNKRFLYNLDGCKVLYLDSNIPQD